MDNKSRKTVVRGVIVGMAVVFGTVINLSANATNGYFQHGYGAGAKAMAGVGTALPQDTATVMHNPAGIVYLGNRVDIGIGAFMPDRDITATGGGTVTDGVYNSSEKLFLVPDIGVSYKIDADQSLSLTMNANGGMNTEYKTNPFGPFGGGANYSSPAGVDLAQAFLGFTYARKFGNHAFGITPTFAVQKFKAYGLQAFTGVSVDSDHVTDNGYDWSYGVGFRVGYLGKFMDDRLSVGVSYQNEMQMTKLDKYQGLFANRGDFDIPAALNVGVAYGVTPKLTVGMDYQWIMYRGVDSVGNDGVMSLNSLAGEARLGGYNHAPGFGWNDVHVLKIGAMYKMNDALTLRAGASYNTETYTDHDMLFNILAPGVIRAHLSAGASYEVKPGHSVNFAYTHAFSASESGTHVSNGNGTLKHRMDQNEVFVGYNYRW